MKKVEYDREKEQWVLFENSNIQVVIQSRTNFPAQYGGHIVVSQKVGAQTPYSKYALFAKMSVVAAAVQKGLEVTGLAPHANIQSNANWAFREINGSFLDVEEGKRNRRLHIHVYGRSPKDPNWGEPIRPAYHQEQQAYKYWGEVFIQLEMNKLAEFLSEEIPQALKESL